MTYLLLSVLCVKDNLHLDESIMPSGTFIIMRISGTINGFKWPYVVETLQTPSYNTAGSTCEEAAVTPTEP